MQHDVAPNSAQTLTSALPTMGAAKADAIWLRIGILLTLIIAFVLGLISFLNYSNYRKTINELNQNSVLVLARDLRQAITLGFSAGLQPQENAQLNTNIGEMLQKHPDIQYIAIIGDSNRELVKGPASPASRERWAARYAEAGVDQVWQVADDANDQIGLSYANDFGAKAGAVVIAYARTPVEQQARQMGWQLGQDALLNLLVLALITLGGVYLLARRMTRRIRAVASYIQGAGTGAAAAPLDDQLLDEHTYGAIADFVATTQEVAHQITAIEQQLGQAPASRPR
ncbi:hypothetical protein H5407_05525 [Mitsuaria sp. WAJ17]|uniref:hypothetical protein n=1 Tax=Mitsuaria sp. WAJ17 TaxID=2761452 RepID=UPI0016022185|nr:hypothetical protein [Mitsuaria sp. WAJ17]MBB2484682.1 hypothetical protein [Mitsuaria sp. WAJ17]